MAWGGGVFVGGGGGTVGVWNMWGQGRVGGFFKIRQLGHAFSAF